jgi:hypothetical protein
MRQGFAVYAVLFGCCLAVSMPADAQGQAAVDKAAAERSRSHLLIPPDGNRVDPSQFLREHFQQAAQGGKAMDVLANPQKYLEPGSREKLENIAKSMLNGELKPDHPLMQALKKVMENPEVLPPEQRQVIEQLRKQNPDIAAALKQAQVDATAPSGASGTTATPTNPASPSDRRRRSGPPPWHTTSARSTVPSTSPDQPSGLRDWLIRQAELLAGENGLLRNSPALQRVLEEFAQYRANADGLGADENAMEDRVTQAMRKVIPASWMSQLSWDRLGKIPLPSFSRVDWPDIPLLDSSSPPLSRAPTDTNVTSSGTTVLARIAGAMGLVVIAWLLYDRLFRHKGPAAHADLGPWPVTPEEVRSPEELIQAFEYLSLLKIGAKARSWNHRLIAAELGGKESERRRMAGHLATLYEQARYAPHVDLLPEHALQAARRELASLAGVSAV